MVIYYPHVGETFDIYISLYCYCGPTITDSTVQVMDFETVFTGEKPDIYLAEDCNQLIARCPTYQGRTIRVYTYDGINSKNIRQIGEGVTDEKGLAKFTYTLIEADLEEYTYVSSQGGTFCLALEVDQTLDQHIVCGFHVLPEKETLIDSVTEVLSDESSTTKTILIGGGALILYGFLKKKK